MFETLCLGCFHPMLIHYISFSSNDDYGCPDCRFNGRECPMFVKETEDEVGI